CSIGPFAQQTLLRFLASTSRAATVSRSADFPVVACYTADLVPPISRWDEDGFSVCSACPCHRAIPNPDISQTDKVFDRFRWPEALNFRLVNSDQRERQLGARTFVDGRVNFKDKCMADRFSSVVIPRKRSVVGSEPEPSVA